MPIFDQGYQHWSGPLSGHVWRWLAIARHGVRVQSRGWVLRLLLLVAWLPAIALVVVLALWGLLEQGSESLVGFIRNILPGAVADPKAYRLAVWTIAYSTFFKVQMAFIMVLVVVAGPNLISRDLRFNALPLYLSRPLGRLDYFLGKLGVIAALVAAVAVIPAVVAYLLGVVFSLDVSVLRDTWRLLPASLAYGLLIVVSAGTLMLALSSLSRRSLYIAITWLGLWLLGVVVAASLVEIRRDGLRRGIRAEEMAKAGNPPPPDFRRMEKGQRARDPWVLAMQRTEERTDRAYAEVARADWRPLLSYTGNLHRLGEGLLDSDGAWVKIGKAMEAPRGMFGAMFGPRRPPEETAESSERRLADRYVPQYPWVWSAGILAALLGFSVCTLSLRVKSLDRLK